MTASDGVSGDFLTYTAVRMSSDGASVIATTYADDSSRGAAYQYSRSGLLWTQSQKVVAPDGASFDYFGINADFVSDGGRFAVVAQGDDAFAGSAYVFGPGQNLAITFAGTGTGTVDSSPSGIDGCTADCDADFAQSGVVVITAVPGGGSSFAGWTGDADCTDGSVTISVDVGCTATFTATPPSSGGSSGTLLTPAQLARLYATPAPSPTPPAAPGLTEGDLISAYPSGDPDIYIVNERGFKRLFLNPVIFGFYGHLGGIAAVKQVVPSVRDSFGTSGLFRNCETGDQQVYALEVTAEDTGVLHPVQLTGEQAVQQDPDFFNKVFCINTNEFNWYPKSPVPYDSVSDLPVYVR